MIISSEAELISFGQKLGQEFLSQFQRDNTPIIVELVGDVGAGKTTLTRGIAKGLGIKEPVTSPSFTISKRYAFRLNPQTQVASQKSSAKNTQSVGELIHYDFYRLEDPGLMVEDFAESISSPSTVTIIEWGGSVKNLLPDGHLTYRIELNDDGTRTIKSNSDRT